MPALAPIVAPAAAGFFAGLWARSELDDGSPIVGAAKWAVLAAGVYVAGKAARVW